MSAELLAAIAARLDDDAPRLVYADALTERQDPRGEFIVLQCRAAKLAPSEPLRAELLQRARDLLEANRAAWFPIDSNLDWRFVRGFPSALHKANLRAFREHVAALEQVPTLRTLELHFGTPRPEDLSGLVQLPLLQRLKSLSFNWHAPPSVILDLAVDRQPHAAPVLVGDVAGSGLAGPRPRGVVRASDPRARLDARRRDG